MTIDAVKVKLQVRRNIRLSFKSMGPVNLLNSAIESGCQCLGILCFMLYCDVEHSYQLQMLHFPKINARKSLEKWLKLCLKLKKMQNEPSKHAKHTDLVKEILEI